MFGITSAYRLFEKVRADYARVEADIADPGAALNCILGLYHLHEWVWATWLKERPAVQATIGIHKKIGSFTSWLDMSWLYFLLVQELANGSKHCCPVHSTKRVKGYGRGPWGVGPYGTPFLLIDLGENRPPPERYLVASTVLKESVNFWTRFFAEHGITDNAEQD